MSAPFMQLYVADYLGDTRHLTTEQHGAYLLLLMTMWRSDGRLPNDAKKLARIAGCTASRWSKIAGDVLAFFEVDGAELFNVRLMFELEKASEKSIKRADAGAKGGAAKALKTNKTPEAIATVLPKHSSEPYSTSEAKASSAPTRVSADAPDFARFWAAYPNKVGKDPARKAFDRAVKRCDVEVMLAAIEQQRTWDQWQRGFVPHAATWLNNGRWQDEPPPTPVMISNTGRQNVPGPDHKQSSREANNARAFAGAEAASRWRADR